MGREIKFRLRKSSRVVGYEIWKPGDAYVSGRWMYISYGEIFDGPFIGHDEKDQYTGLKDKNGKEIYEGDVLEVTEHQDHIPDKLDRCTIKWTDERGGFNGATIHPTKYDDYPQCEIIGNIYEDPGLLDNE